MKCRVKTKEGTLRLIGLNLLITPHPTKVELFPDQAQMLMDDYGVEVEPVEAEIEAATEEPVAEQSSVEPKAEEPVSEEAPENEDEAESADSAPKPRRKKGGD